MNILNFGHPTTAAQEEALRGHYNEISIIRVPVQLDAEAGVIEQINALLGSLKIDPDEWQTKSWSILAPGMSPAALVLAAAMHGRMGHFPELIRLKQAGTGFEVAEFISLDAVRQAARTTR